MRFISVIFFFFCMSVFSTVADSATPIAEQAFPSDHMELIHHDIKVIIHPDDRRFAAEDRIVVPEKLLPEFRFLLHRSLNPSSPTEGVEILKNNGGNADALSEAFKAVLPSGVNTFVIKYGGAIDHPIEQFGKEQARGYRHTPGLISEEGVYLAGSSLWYPVIRGTFITFNLSIELPGGWDAVSQGERTVHAKDANSTRVRWESPEPQEEIYLAGAAFHEYTKPGQNVPAMVFLREPDEVLAGKYLEATDRYISMYDRLIGPYPYKKFALVENFWETGFGMPSFTLLGPRVIRFPFIIDSSYPHEILHNWWGNCVFPDYAEGNWSEGLTAYLSDHLIKEQQGEGAEYRMTTLQKYADYVFSSRDFPISMFRSRHSSSSEAIGYGKSMMFFHMLRMEMGDDIFTEGLREFYKKNKFRYATFSDIRKSFEHVSKKNLEPVFSQWITWTGAPGLKIRDVNVIKQGDKYSVAVIIEQAQSGTAYRLRVPVAVTMEGEGDAFQTVVDVFEKKQSIRLSLPARPLRVDVDPESDLFRRLDREEIPPAISQALGAKKMLVVLPSSETDGLLNAYRELAVVLGKSGPDVIEIRVDNEITDLPLDRSVAVLGFKNRFMQDGFRMLSEFEITVTPEKMRIGGIEIPVENHSFVMTAPNHENREMAVMLIASDRAEALSGLGRKLPHYHKYSYLAFEGDEPVNIAKGRFPVLNSPMTIFIPSETGHVTKAEMGRLRQRRPLAELQPVFSAERMMDTIRFLASSELNGRGSGSEGLDRAAEYIAGKFREAGLLPAGDEEGSYFQTWAERDEDNPENKIRMRNVIGVIPGQKPEWSGQSVVIGAHYDHLGLGSPGALKENEGKIHFGADDNASGVAVLIELAGVLGSKANPGRNIVFAAFSGEETGKKGSKYYAANQKRYPVQQSVGMLNLDTVGRMRSNRLFIIGASSAEEWGRILGEAGHVAGVEIETVSEELDSSDQISFQEAGIPAVQFFTGPHEDYHRPTDTFERINSEGLAKVASVAKEAVEYLAGRELPLTANVKAFRKTSTGISAERKVVFGIIPDFAYIGKGCRLDGVVQGSPAQKSGLAKGDIIMNINSKTVDSLKDLSEILKSMRPGDRIEILYVREGREMKAISGVIGR
jgi:aminopeptidase N